LVGRIVPHRDTVVFQIVFGAMAIEVPNRRGKRVLRVLGNARWRHIEPVYLPPCRPGFNPLVAKPAKRRK
jgi:hypothetical protein